MRKCLGCDFPGGTIQPLIERIEDKATLVTLACDVAERVCHLAPDQAFARARLDVARGWQSNSHAAVIAADQASEFANRYLVTRTGDAMMAALCAVAWATKAATAETLPLCRERALDAALKAEFSWREGGDRGSNWDSERIWQLEHARELTCTCPLFPDAGLPGARGRRSLLARESPRLIASRPAPLRRLSGKQRQISPISGNTRLGD